MIQLLETFIWVLRFFTGASIFSFVNVVIYRLPAGEGVAAGRSHCRSCAHVLSGWELIPCVSYLLLRGKCHSCGKRISPRYFWIETLGGALFAGCVLAFPQDGYGLVSLRGGLVFLYLAVLTAVAGIDYDTQLIYDICHIAIFALGCAGIWLFPETGILSRLIGAAAVSGPMLLLILLIPGGFGGGDVKLSAACGWFLGVWGAVAGTFLAVLAGGGFAAWMLARRKLGRRDRFAFGPFLAGGYALAAFFGERIVDWYIGLF